MALKLLEHPNPCPSGYSLHMYCKYENPAHRFNEFPHEFVDEEPARVRKAMRRSGWILHRDGTGTCPKCAKELGLRT